MIIAVHTLVKNEARFIWYAVMSVIRHVDKILLWDTGSTDRTLDVVEALRKTQDGKSKIEFRQVGPVDADEFTEVRQQMLDRTQSEWLLLLDGDEVWWEDSIKELVKVTKSSKGKELDSIVNPYYNIVGDIYHYQEESAGRYEIDGRKGHLTIRAMNRKIPGLHVERPHGQQGFFDKDRRLVQARSPKKRKFLDARYLHFTHVVRSSSRQEDLSVPKRDVKYKNELGVSFPPDFYYPEVFFRAKPSWIYSPWEKSFWQFETRSFLSKPIKSIKRRIFPIKSGY